MNLSKLIIHIIKVAQYCADLVNRCYEASNNIITIPKNLNKQLDIFENTKESLFGVVLNSKNNVGTVYYI